MTETAITIIQWGAIISTSLFAAVIDVKSRRIPNRLCGLLFLAGLLWSFQINSFQGLTQALAASFVLALPFILLFIFAGGGTGDAKLAGALGVWLSINESFIALICIFLAGGILAVIIALYKRKIKYVLMNIILLIFEMATSFKTKKWITQINSAQTATADVDMNLTMPYSVAIFAGLCSAGCILWLR